MKIKRLWVLWLLSALAMPALAAEGLPGATVKSEGARPARVEHHQAMRERCQADPEKCRAEMQARREQCRADPEKCRAERQARREQWCAENPQRCKELQARVEQRRAQCKANPEQCRKEMQARLTERFRKADADGNGALSRVEAEKGMPRVARHFDQIDANRDGQITMDEIMAARKARAQRKGTPL